MTLAQSEYENFDVTTTLSTLSQIYVVLGKIKGKVSRQ